jgi:hypothetical protein
MQSFAFPVRIPSELVLQSECLSKVVINLGVLSVARVDSAGRVEQLHAFDDVEAVTGLVLCAIRWDQGLVLFLAKIRPLQKRGAFN